MALIYSCLSQGVEGEKGQSPCQSPLLSRHDAELLNLKEHCRFATFDQLGDLMAWRSALSRNLQELRVHLCQKGDASQGARDFVLSQYQHLKKANPKFPILIRECSGVEARLIARYDFGVEHSVPINGLDSNTINSKLEELVKKGESMPRSTESDGQIAA